MAIPLVWDTTRIEQQIGYAEQHPICFAAIKAASERGDFDEELIKPYEYPLTVTFVREGEEEEVVNGVFTFTIEEQAPGAWFRHLSILPAYSRPVVAFICAEYGINLDAEDVSTYLDGAKAVNIDQPYPEYKPPSTVAE